MARHIMPEDSLNLGHHNFKKYSETPPTGRTVSRPKVRVYPFVHYVWLEAL